MAMKRLIHLLLVVSLALTLSACAAATNPVLEYEAPIGAVNHGP
jgi:starvation-inducible outer membrane lipoprotein